jgi:hypothetical protein
MTAQLWVAGPMPGGFPDTPHGRYRARKAGFVVPLRPPGSKPVDPALRFDRMVEKGDDCWSWTGALDPYGYGRFNLRRKTVLAHRFSYERFVGAIPVGLELDHLCRNRRCVNPSHLEPVTGHENVLRSESPSALNARKTHCFRGHALSGDNLSRWNNHRICVACRRASDLKRPSGWERSRQRAATTAKGAT